jgi:hypothetical protein
MLKITATNMSQEGRTELTVEVKGSSVDLINEIRAILLELHHRYDLETAIAMRSIIDDIEED